MGSHPPCIVPAALAIAITGAAGYLGTQLLQRPEALEQPVVGFDVRPPRATPKTLTFLQQDIQTPMTEALKENRVDTLIHLAFVLNPMHDAAEQRRVNLGGLERVLTAADEAKLKRLIVLSSATAYGALPDNPAVLDETHPLRAEPSYPYAYEKRLVEERCAAYHRDHPEVEIVIVRPSVVLGPNVDNFISRYAMRSVSPVVAGLNPPTQFVDEEDAAKALWFLVRNGNAGAYNIGGPDPLPIKEIARISGSRVVSLPEAFVKVLLGVGWAFHVRAITEAPPGILPFVQYPWVVGTRKIESLGFRFGRTTGEVLERFLAARRGPKTAN
jgi:UDP-glucose 4-epimerase